ncbi:FecR family protein [Novosphingobium sp. KACC 22771]|uniref:FecR family protein n=1 Tax=Novosphingobium sp. KACC 22771 TaxID=3025670 RepID=UPI0023667CFB|nr:FecR domain-containing protein [Novosphingobium sp. KACC 22771]WDF74224.1 FecR domain-containing protein [Novosphingobium sp. KACC 22771]
MMEHAETPRPHSQLRDEAADWFTLMRGPEADSRRQEFEAWLAQDATHRRAYNRIAETFSLGKFLSEGRHTEQADLPKSEIKDLRGMRFAFTGAGLVSLITLAAMGAFYWKAGFHADQRLLSPQIAAAPHQGIQSLKLATALGEIRSFKLADGSTVTLDTGSLLLVSLGSQQRDLELIRGHARFEVAHEARPFVVSAGSGTVTARGTIFDVAVADGSRIEVRLLRGAVDVNMPGATGQSAHAPIRLSPGQHIAFREDGKLQWTQASNAENSDAQWPDGLRDYENVRLGDLIADANRYATLPLVAASDEVSEIRISGTFRVTDTGHLAQNLAGLLGLTLTSSPRALSLARPCQPGRQNICQPPS